MDFLDCLVKKTKRMVKRLLSTRYVTVELIGRGHLTFFSRKIIARSLISHTFTILLVLEGQACQVGRSGLG